MRFHKKKFKKKCWIYDSTIHLKVNYPVHRESLLRKRVSELEERIQEIDAALFNRQNNMKKIDRKRKKKICKKKKKRHLKQIKAMDAVVKIRGHIL